MSHVIGIDPGETTGFAWFTNGRLSRAFARPFDEFIADPPYTGETMVVILEFPKWRPKARAEIDDLLWLAYKAGRIEQFYRRHGGDFVELVYPHVWKGSVPKDIHNQRVLKVLTAEELAVVPVRPRSKKNPYDHNCVDAVGIGLWKLGRLR